MSEVWKPQEKETSASYSKRGFDQQVLFLIKNNATWNELVLARGLSAGRWNSRKSAFKMGSKQMSNAGVRNLVDTGMSATENISEENLVM